MAWTATENFDSYTDGNNLNTLNGGSSWNGAWVVGSGTWTASSLQSQSGTLSGRLSTTVADQYCYRPVTSTTGGTLVYYIRTASTGNSNYINLSASTAHATSIKVLGGFEANNIVFYDNVTQRTLVTTYAANTWYKVTIVYDGVTNTYTVQIDSGTVFGPYAFYNGGTGAITNLHFYRGGGTGDFFFDTIGPVVTAGPVIAVDATSTSAGGTATPQSWSHTCTGSNLILIVNVYSNAVGDVTGVTYNGVALTKFANYSYSPREGNLWYLINPATGTNTISVAHTSTANFVVGAASSYTGAAQTGQPDSALTSQTTASGTTLTATNTVVATGSWLVMGGICNGNALGAGTGATLRITGGNVAVSIFDSNGAPGTGSKSMTATESPASNFAIGMVSIAPVAATATISKLALLGVG